jgi:tetratricopeptide (TPR) repeat protein
MESDFKTRLFDLMDRAHTAQRELAASLTAAEREERGTPERWAFKDQIAHVSYWQRAQAQRLEAAAEGEKPPSFDDYQTLNEKEFEGNRYRAWEEIEAESERVLQKLKDVVARFGEKDLTDPARYAWQKGTPLIRSLLGNAFTHPLAHYSEIYQRRGEMSKAVKIQESAAELLSDLGGSEGRGNALYNLACFYALNGEGMRAIELLGQALPLLPTIKPWAREDPDLITLHGNPEYEALVRDDAATPQA